MKFLSMYKTVECDAPPTRAEMEQMGKLMEGGSSCYGGRREGCMPAKLGARVRQSKGQTAVTDGIFSEAKEVLCGLAIPASKFARGRWRMRAAALRDARRTKACAKKAEMRQRK